MQADVGEAVGSSKLLSQISGRSPSANRDGELGGFCTIYKTLSKVHVTGPYPSEDVQVASHMWAQKTRVIYVMRRAGCPFCRSFAVALMKRRGEFLALGASPVVVVSQRTGADAFSLVAWQVSP